MPIHVKTTAWRFKDVTGSAPSHASWVLKMAAPDENTLLREDNEVEEMEAGDSDEDDMEEEEKGVDDLESKVYVPGVQPLQPGEELEMDRSAYRMYHECQTGRSVQIQARINIYQLGCKLLHDPIDYQ